VFAVLERVAATDTTIPLEGESGTGKDLAAQSVHQLSGRQQGPFVVVDCGTIRSTLAESELFGHRKGAFTGAEQDRPGVFESAQDGTVFLDEIGELELGLQVKLLRLLENHEVKRLGENRYRSVNVRVIAATNRDLGAEVQGERFRQDLFYRLSVVRVRMPPLRERHEDLALLAKVFVQKLRSDLDPVKVISDQVLNLFMNYSWPGNVRELRNVVERLLLFPESPEKLLPQVGSELRHTTQDLLSMKFPEARLELNERFEKIYLSGVMDACGGVVAAAAERSGIPRQSLYRLLAKHRLLRK
jgi:transcriptional regulator with PAS, ATPase and Fis domain